MALISPLDLEQIFVVNLAGSLEIFTFVAIILIGFAVAKAKLNNKESLAMFAIFGVVMAAYLPALYILINLIAGLFAFYAMGKITK